MSEEKSSVSQILTAFAVGAVVGAGLALLYAPASGRETRELLAKRARELKDKVGDTLDSAKEMLVEKKERVAAAFQAGKQAMCESKSDKA